MRRALKIRNWERKGQGGETERKHAWSGRDGCVGEAGVGTVAEMSLIGKTVNLV